MEQENNEMDEVDNFLPTERAMELLKKDGVIVSPSQAAAIVKLLMVFASIAVAQYLRGEIKTR